jgi:hypothetical protein
MSQTNMSTTAILAAYNALPQEAHATKIMALHADYRAHSAEENVPTFASERDRRIAHATKTVLMWNAEVKRRHDRAAQAAHVAQEAAYEAMVQEEMRDNQNAQQRALARAEAHARLAARARPEPMRALVAPAKAQAEVDAGKAKAFEAMMQKMLDLETAHQETSKKAQADNERLVKHVADLEARLEVQTAPAPNVQAESMEMECARSLYAAAVRERKAVVAAGGTVAELREAYGQEIELRDALAAIEI